MVQYSSIYSYGKLRSCSCKIPPKSPLNKEGRTTPTQSKLASDCMETQKETTVFRDAFLASHFLQLS